MLARVNTKALAAALKRTMPATMTGRLPILNGVRLEVSRKTMTITTTNIDLTIEASIPVETGSVKGVVIPPAGLLSKLVATIGADTTEISAGDDLDVSVCGGDMVATLRGHQITEWPNVEHCEADTQVHLSRETLDKIGRILPFARTEGEISPFHGVHFAGDQVRVTDTYRAGLLTLDEVVPFAAITVPADTVRAVLASVDDAVMISDGSTVTFTDDETRWTTKGMVGEYASFERFLEESKPDAATFPVAQLIDTLKRVSALDANSPVRFTLEGDKVQLSTVTADVGSIVDFVPVTGVKGDEFSLMFNGRYLASILAAVDDRDEFELHLDGDKKPAISECGPLRVFIMPHRELNKR